MTYAIPLPNGKQQFVDINGAPLVDGTVEHYVPSSMTPKDTYQNFAATILNDNPLTLDARGQAIIWGIGRYRQIVKDVDGNEIWDQETAALVDQPYEAGFYFPDAGVANDVVGKWSFTQYVTFPTDFDGAEGAVETPPASDIVLNITRNGAVIGAMHISSLGAVTFTTSISNPVFVPGDYMGWAVQSSGAASSAGYNATMLGVLTHP